MTDLEKFKEFFDFYGIEFSPNTRLKGREVIENEYIVMAETNNVDGYPGFFNIYYFNSAGVFLHMGIWE